MMTKRLICISLTVILNLIISLPVSNATGESNKISERELVNCKLDVECQYRYISNILEDEKREGSKVSIMSYLNLLKTNQQLNVSCHTVTHKLGEYIYKKYGIDFYEEKYKGCLSGFLHGFLIAIAKESKSESSFYKKSEYLCSKISESEEKRQCYHGMGHGLSTRSVKLENSLLTCLKIKMLEFKRECVTGSAMEWSNSRIEKRDTKLGELEGLCQIMREETLLRECLAQILQHQDSMSRDPLTFIKFCEGKEKVQREGCFEALGYILVNNNFSKINENIFVVSGLINSYCEKEGRYWCLHSIIHRSLSLKLIESDSICKKVIKSIRDVCASEVKSLIDVRNQ